MWGIWHRTELNDSTFEQQNKWSMQVLERLQPRSQGSVLPALRTDGKEIAPEDAEKLWVSLVQSQIVAQQTNDEAIDFKLSSKCACRMLQERRTLGITERNLSIRDGLLEKLWGEGFLSRRNFFRYQIPCMNFF